MRAWWEVPPERILDGANGPDWRKDLPAFQAWCRQRTFAGKRWVPFAKGGEYSPYYADLHLVVNWERDGEEMKAWADPLYGNSGWSRIIKSVDFYFRPGLTWPLRTTVWPQLFPLVPFGRGCFRAHKRCLGILCNSQEHLSSILAAVMNNSTAFVCDYLLHWLDGSVVSRLLSDLRRCANPMQRPVSRRLSTSSLWEATRRTGPVGYQSAQAISGLLANEASHLFVLACRSDAFLGTRLPSASRTWRQAN